MADDAAPFDPEEFASAEEAVNTILWFGFPAEKRDRARAWLTAAVAYAQEREGMMTRREVADLFLSCCHDASWTGWPGPKERCYAYAHALGYRGAEATAIYRVQHALALTMNADRGAQEARP